MRIYPVLRSALLAAGCALPIPALAEGADLLAEAIVEYMDFATYESGIILPQQIDQSLFASAMFVDTRDAEQFEASHIPGSINIDWRAVPGRLDELPETGMVILYCNTGSLSAQATFAARVMGRENVVVLQSGFRGWLKDAAWKPN